MRGLMKEQLLNMKEDFQMIHGGRTCGITYKLKIKEKMKMEKEKFKIGDLVRPIEEDDGNKNIVNKKGRIIRINDKFAEIEFEEDIDGWGSGGRFWDVLLSKLVKYDNSIKVGDRVRVNKKATIEDFTKNHWNGCQMTTLAFIKQQGDSDKIFVVEESHNDDCVDLKSEESNEHYIFVNINILEKTEDVVKEMTIEEISKELGYKIKIKEEE